MYLESNNHSVFSLNFHLVMVTKYRRQVIDDPVSERLRSIFERIGADYHVTVDTWNHDHDHVHVLLRTHPMTCFTKFINAYKSASSRLIKQEFPALRQSLWKEMFWSRSFCLISTGGAPMDTIRGYIESQGERNAH